MIYLNNNRKLLLLLGFGIVFLFFASCKQSIFVPTLEEKTVIYGEPFCLNRSEENKFLYTPKRILKIYSLDLKDKNTNI